MSEYIQIEGGTPLQGTVQISGAKNAGLPLLISTLLSSGPCTLRNVPNLKDTALTLNLLEHFGARIDREDDRVTIETEKLAATEASYSLVKALRASFWVLGPLLARGRAARVALPGGDIIGARPVDMHLEALSKMGADIRVKHGVVFALAKDGLRPAEIDLRFPSVGATHQIIMAASLTPGQTVIRGAAREPEIVALADFLNEMGAAISGAGESDIVIEGQEELGAADFRLIGDRVEAATYLCAGLSTAGVVRAHGFCPQHLGEFLEMLGESCDGLSIGDDWVEVDARNGVKPMQIKTGPYPQFATDIQAPLMAALTQADGESSIEENVFEGRFGHAAELCRMGADIRVAGQLATIHGPSRLSSADVEALDIRAGAALVVAALAARGVSRIHEPQHIRRGYSYLEEKLRSLGAKVGTRVGNAEDFMFTGC